MTSKKANGFTIVELLTVMSIIIILMSLLMPGMQRTRRYARGVVQRAQFSEIAKGLELYRNDHQETYPDSGPTDGNATTLAGYCGAMKLCEALLGQDGMGFHPSSTFQANTSTYLFDLCKQVDSATINGSTALKTNLRERTKYLDSDSIKATRLKDLYSWYTDDAGKNYYATTAKFQSTTDGDASTATPTQYPNSVITDAFLRMNSRCTTITNNKKLGMPVLYYKADTSKLVHDISFDPAAYGGSTNPNPSIYNFDDNYAITGLGCPWESTLSTTHPMWGPTSANPANVKIFYKAITNTKITSTPRPHNEDTYILLSAGWDGLYGTADDVYNFSD
jgi:type II secretory pathway pseudopilin PulG